MIAPHAALATSLAPDVDVWLLPQRALFWPAEATLFVADLHLGKADVFVQRGIPIPLAISAHDLQRLGAIIEATGAERLVVLGDLLHARGSRSPGVHEALTAWRSAHPSLELLLVLGNHDRHAGPPPADVGFVLCGDEAQVGPFRCVHEPLESTDGLTLCGHLHPLALLSEHRGASRLPCFHLRAQQMVLPALGHFTGGSTIHARRGDRCWVIAGEAVVDVSPRATHS
jgi:DNA ligase-associated metallophosphoesterase